MGKLEPVVPDTKFCNTTPTRKKLMLGKDILKRPIPVALAVIMRTLTVGKVPSSHSVLGSISANKSTDEKCCTKLHTGERGNKMMETLRKGSVQVWGSLLPNEILKTRNHMRLSGRPETILGFSDRQQLCRLSTHYSWHTKTHPKCMACCLLVLFGLILFYLFYVSGHFACIRMSVCVVHLMHAWYHRN